jgi:hypothetical protein
MALPSVKYTQAPAKKTGKRKYVRGDSPQELVIIQEPST